MSVSSPTIVAMVGLFTVLLIALIVSLWSTHIKRHKPKNITFVASYGSDVVTFQSLTSAINDATVSGYHQLAAWGNEPENMVRVYLVSEEWPGHNNLNPAEYFF